MQKRENVLLLVLLAVAGIGAWAYFTKQGQAVVTGASEAISSEVEKVADLGNSTLNLIKKFEGFAPNAYRDARGWSIGYGHYMGASPTMQTISEPDAYDLLHSDVQSASDTVKASVQVDLTQNQFDALVSLAYNIGNAAFANSTLVKKLNAGDYQGAADQFAVWRKSGGQVNDVLVARRQAEAQLFLA